MGRFGLQKRGPYKRNPVYNLSIDLYTPCVLIPILLFHQVKSEGLAQAVAQEWRSQKDTVNCFTCVGRFWRILILSYSRIFTQIMMSQMHLTGLANVSIDNPTKVTPEQMTESVMNFLDTDTVLFFSDVSKK